MFRFAASNKVFWPVELASRGEDGEPVTATAHIGYRILTREELRAHDRAGLTLIADGTLSFAERLAQGDKLQDGDTALLRDRVYGWRGVVDNDDKPIPFSPEMLDAMLADPLLFNALLRGLFAASRGAKEKNSLPGPGGAPAPAQRTASTGSGTATTAGATSPAPTAGTPADA